MPEFLHVLFNLVEKHSPVFFLTEMLSVFGFVAFIVHASIFCLRFSQKQSANQPKKIQGNGLLLNIKAHAKIQALLKEKKIYPKKSLTSLLHQAIQILSPLYNANCKFLHLTSCHIDNCPVNHPWFKIS